MKMHQFRAISLLAGTLLLATSHSAQAYIGPGAGLAAIGTAIALFGAVALAIVGFVWYPIKRIRARLKGTKKDRAATKNVSAS